MDIHIRHENRNDYRNITKLNDAAFGQPQEGLLIKNIRQNNLFKEELSLVASLGDTIVGHILFFPARITLSNRAYQSISLAPMAVHPDFQRRGIGGMLIKQGFISCLSHGFSSVVVLGHPGYYPKFGFKPASTWEIYPPMNDVPDEAFMAIELVQDALKDVKGIVQYPIEYDVAL